MKIFAKKKPKQDKTQSIQGKGVNNVQNLSLNTICLSHVSGDQVD